MIVSTFHLEALKKGTKKQTLAYQDIMNSGIMDKLKPFSPALAGTIPLDICTEESDLDIICYFKDLRSFSEELERHFGHYQAFQKAFTEVRGVSSLVASFKGRHFTFEVFCQPVPVIEQYAVIHFFIEEKILEYGGKAVAQKIRAFKNQGIKTEPAFAKLIGIRGDPYHGIAALAKLTTEELRHLVNIALSSNGIL